MHRRHTFSGAVDNSNCSEGPTGKAQAGGSAGLILEKNKSQAEVPVSCFLDEEAGHS